MYANSVLAAFSVAGLLIRTSPAISVPSAGCIIGDAIEDERLQYWTLWKISARMASSRPAAPLSASAMTSAFRKAGRLLRSPA
jgi:hypothetical protein